jgi:putative transcriptional regulator
MTPLLPRGPSLAPSHHPAIESLADYAAGQLRAGFDVVVATHLRGCAQCRGDVAQLEAVGGGLLETIAPAPLSDHALAAMLARLDEPVPMAAPVKSGPPARTLDQLLASARRRWIAPGTWIAMIDTPHDPDDRVFLLGVGAGRATAPHRHHGAEMTQVLTGALTDDGVIYRAGDLVERDQSGVHHPQVAGDEACICLLAARGRLKATTLIGRIAFALAGV